ncbi:hypothetical protein NE237_011907 [Protea cynaroides]|uniref:RNase H type-1 domain-containing protein n=1 Tax=Protea cynaroides TaxID=273540 RepID=A0A9Q0GWZ8_9MAGN|nr:hypothetical protein NE237_011907 [Protea cynaroides]
MPSFQLWQTRATWVSSSATPIALQLWQYLILCNLVRYLWGKRAIRSIMLAAISEGVEHIIIETDNMELRDLRGVSSRLPAIAIANTNILHLCPYFLNCSFHISREINSVADSFE